MSALTVKANILLVDDDKTASEALIRSLKRRGASYDFHLAENRDQALRLAEDLSPEAIVLDLSLDPIQGPESGLALIGDLLDVASCSRVLVLTGHGGDDFGVRALKEGAASFLEKPAEADHLLALISDAVSFAALKRQYQRLSSTPENAGTLLGISTKSRVMHTVLERAAFAASTSQPLLILGETGVGKGVLAQAVHNADTRSRGAFIRFQPSFGSSDLTASELFGHKKGAFTGAISDRKGLLEEAHEGTLFIDEVGELSPETQVLLLHTLQERVFRPVGGSRDIRSSFRLIAATNRTLEELTELKLLRADFFHRIAHVTITIPPLRERPEDILDLAQQFLSALCHREKLSVQGFSADAVRALRRYSWPGNVRELLAVVESGAYHSAFEQRSFIEPADLGLKQRKGSRESDLSFRERVQLYELQLVRDAMQKHGGNQCKAADSLKIDRIVLRRILSRGAK